MSTLLTSVLLFTAKKAESLLNSSCNLCPRACNVLRDNKQCGVCGAPYELMIARAALHFWEEPPLSGSAGSGAIFFAYCPLHCVYCQNRELAAGDIGWVMRPEELAQLCINLQNKGAFNINFVTPTHYTYAIKEALNIARTQGLSLPIVWNTSSYESLACINSLQGDVDIYLADFKYASTKLARRYSNAQDYPAIALKAIECMREQVGEAYFDTVNGEERMVKGLIVRHLLLPGDEGLANAKEALGLLFEAFGNSIRYSIMNQYTPLIDERLHNEFPELCSTPLSEAYEELLDFADELGIEDYFWQDGEAAKESFIPKWDGEGLFDLKGKS